MFFNSLIFTRERPCLLKITSTSVAKARQSNQYYYMSTDRLYNLDFSLVYEL